MSLKPGNYSLVLDSPLGRIGVRHLNGVVSRVDYLPRSVRLKPACSDEDLRLVDELEQYFVEPGFSFSVRIRLEGTPFQQRVWSALRKIPCGDTRTYGQLATELGSGPRAVGNACRRNPVSIIVPCHRVVAASGMGGYSGRTGDRAIWRKHWLLVHEGAACEGLKTAISPQTIVNQSIQRNIHA